jgi:hypothetical protein
MSICALARTRERRDNGGVRRLLLLLPVLLSCNQQVIATGDLPPEAVILSPDHETIVDAPGITFIGQVDDNDPLDSLAVAWTSDLEEEPLFVGNPDSSGRTTFTVSTLSVGTHIIELRVTDSEGQEDLASITLVVTAAIDPPTAIINEPQGSEGYDSGVPVVFEGIVIASDGSPGFYPVEWTSDLFGPLYTGSTTLDGVTDFDTLLEPGTHLIQLRVFEDGVTLALESVTIVVSPATPGVLDQDGDGFCPDRIDVDGDGRCRGDEITGPDSPDCNDFAAVVCPGCPEICDGFPDNNCDGILDPDDQDLDSDGWSPCAGDCDDGAPANFPTNPEVCDGADNDCNGLADFDALGEVDGDGDNARSCADCNDAEPLAFPGNAEVCDGVDNDCHGVADDGYDVDSDGFTVCEGDCNDNQPLAFPGNAEVCDGVDNDCDGTADEGYDSDGDGVTTCNGHCNDNQPLAFPGNAEVCDGIDNDCDGVADNQFDNDNDGWTTCAGDCNDVNPAVNPGVAEICDGIDNDCNDGADEGFDVDGDGWTVCAGDCNDGNGAIYPGRPEVCDGVDNDCDTLVDEGFDQDNDGVTTCAGDCNDLNPAVYPGAAEVCDTQDNDCDGLVNENQAGLYEAWETSASSPGYPLSGFGPQLVFGSGTCSIGGFLKLQPGSGSVNGTFSSPQDLWDIYEFDTGLTSNIAAWFAFLSSGQGLPPSCSTGQISWSSTVPIPVAANVDGTVYSGTGNNGSVTFSLSIFQLFDVDYRITVQPLASWVNCNNSYTLNMLIP